MSKGLKLGQLPDRVPVKVTAMISPHLKKALDDYAAVYATTYGQKEALSELIPYMLEAFLSADAKFREARKSLNGEMQPPRPRKPRTTIGES
ncbi:MAG: DUF2274 domain-containing protein [Parvibaculaceae bacterium]